MNPTLSRHPASWLAGGRTRLDLRERGLIMGILNVTPDSFSDGGDWMDPARAVDHALQMVAEGAEIIDVGGESTRPGAAEVDAAEELRRVLPVIESLRSQTNALISIDTSKATVAEAALGAGADILNDVTGLEGDSRMLPVAASSRAGVIVMHMKGRPRDMQANPSYDDVTLEVMEYLRARCDVLEAAGIALERIAIDPGIGFGKTASHNLELLRGIPRLAELGRPVVVGVSRKSFIGKVLGLEKTEDREWPTVALTCYGYEKGARIFRVHAVRSNSEALRMTGAILSHG